VIFGAAQPPACVDDPDLGAYRGDASTAPVRFRVSTSGRHRRTAEGIGGAGPVVVPAGSVRLVVDLQPALQFDALPLVPGGTARLTVIDFPALDPPVREWSWDLDAGAASPEAGGPGDDGP